VRILLDSHVFLWWNADDPRLVKRVKKLISDPANSPLLSVASAWEIAIKVHRGRLRMPEPVSTYVPSRLAHYGIQPLPVTLPHVLETAALQLHHGDPFDRLLIAQARVEGIPILTSDSDFRKYSVEVLW
jgi:PIN domain nuclease of toxin-antitoxin system